MTCKCSEHLQAHAGEDPPTNAAYAATATLCYYSPFLH